VFTFIRQLTLKGTREFTELSFGLGLAAGKSRGKIARENREGKSRGKRKELNKERQRKRAGNGVGKTRKPKGEFTVED